MVFILGSAIGSFLSVAIYRLRHHEKKILFGRSMCPSCKKQLKWKHLVPIFSWLFLRGKCGYCGQRISVHYMLLELLTGISFLALFLNWNFVDFSQSIVNPDYLSYAFSVPNLEYFIFYALMMSFLIAIFFYDLMYQEIPDQFSLPAIALAIAGGLIFGSPDWISMALGGVFLGGFFLLQFVVSKGRWIGGGDIRLGVLMGVLLGWDLGLMALVIGYLIGSIVSLVMLITRRATRKTAIALGPFLITGVVATMFYGNTIMDWYLNTLL